MLSEILYASAKQQQEGRSRHALGISCSSLFPCPYRLRLVHENRMPKQEWTSQQILNADDGWWQEEQSVRRLAAAGVQIVDRQTNVTVGRSHVPGSYDGAFTLVGTRYLWEHKAYDSQSQAIQFLQQYGMNKLPSQKAQTNGYMLGGGFEWCDFFVKVKNNNSYIDVAYQIDRPFILEIVEWCDKIRLDNWKPEPEKCKWCGLCGHDCFEEEPDFSWIASADEAEMVEKWKKGKSYTEMGELMMKEADQVFIGVKNRQGKIVVPGLIGDKDVLMMPGLQIIKNQFNRFEIDKSLVLKHYGAEGLALTGVDKPVTQYRHKEV